MKPRRDVAETPIWRTILAGVVGGLALSLAAFATFTVLGFGLNRNGILVDPSLQSPKLIAVWTQLQPLPLVLTNPAPIIAGFVLFGIGHAFIYRSVARAWAEGIVGRGLRMSGIVYLLSFAFFEFFTPFNLLGEPAALIGLELSFWAVVALAGAFAIVVVSEWKRSR